MRVTLESGLVSVSLYDLLDNLPAEARADLIDSLACQNEVIDEVANQIIDGYTSLNSHGSRCFGTNESPTSGIDLARRRIAEVSSEIAAKEIADLVALVKRERERADKANAELFDLQAKQRGVFL
jgi:hypothetical protein